MELSDCEAKRIDRFELRKGLRRDTDLRRIQVVSDGENPMLLARLP
jgi:hypothetical protein